MPRALTFTVVQLQTEMANRIVAAVSQRDFHEDDSGISLDDYSTQSPEWDGGDDVQSVAKTASTTPGFAEGRTQQLSCLG
jgi:hypothetical protein